MAAEVDVRVISNFSSLSESAISTLLDSPTAELVKSLLANITTKAKECDQVKSQKIRLEVELEQSVRTRESKIKVFKNSAEKSLADTSKLRVELQQSENARSQLQSEIEQSRSSTTNNASQSASLQSRISSLEASNRDTVVLLESKTTACEKLAQDLSAQHQKAVELRKQIATLEQSVQSASTAAGTAKFKEQSLVQELDLAKKNNEWLDNELKTKLADHAKFRKEKNARISELSRSNEQYISEAEALRRSESALKSRVDDQIQKFEENLQEIQQLREQKIIDADAFRVDLESATRLAELQKASADTAKQRAQELAISLDEAKDSFAEQLGHSRAETETEKRDKDAAERRISELEARIEQLESEVEEARARPGTPLRGINGGTSTPSRPGTPTGIFSPASATRMKGGLSMTQMYSAYEKLERELASERRAKDQLQASLEEIVDTLESNKPEIEELRADHDRQQAELVEMSTLVDKANREREAARKEARNYQSQAESRAQEIKMLTQQVRDGNAQVRVLLVEQHIRDNGQMITSEEMEQLRQTAVAQDVSDLSSVGKVISENLATFKSIEDLQVQNNKIRAMLRELGEKMESNENREREQTQQREHQELVEAQAQNTSLLDQLTTLKNQMKSHLKEREMFRGLMNRRGLPQHVDPNDFSRSMPLPAGSAPMRGLDESVQGSAHGGDADYAKLLRDLQLHFDTYRQEAATDHTTLRSQIEGLTQRNSQLQTEVARITSQLSGATQQREMLQTSFNMLQAQNLETQKRSEAAMTTATRQEMKTQQAAEELVETKGVLDGLRRESANLKAEKDLWKTVEKRLIDDNDALRNERSRLDQLNGSLQSLLNEREQSDGETRRRLQAQAESLESELQIVKRKLNDEIEENKRATLRREFEHEQSQKRIDDLVTSLSSVREEFAATKTTRDHLQTNVDELTVELRSAEERLAVFTQPPPDPASEINGADESALSREQELAVEVSELKRDLELKISELARATENVDVYKDISQTAEESLQQLSETTDQYREETDAAIAEKDQKIKDLEQRIEDISSELSTTNKELSKLRDEQSESGRKLDEQRTSLEGDIARLKEEADRNAEKADFNIEAAKAQQRIAEEYQQNYETELVKHADAAKSLHTIRAEANQLRLEMVDLKTQVETAQTSLSQKEESWLELKDRYERELTDLKTRREEVIQQNTILHGQLETLTKQIASVRRDRAATAESEVASDGAATQTAESGREEVQEVIRYLRREKDIVEVQYHLSTQETKRLRQQLDFTQSQLDDTRLKLDQQRRTEADTERNALNHTKLMETLNELNLYRESSVTLRAEAKQAAQALSEKTRRVEELVLQIEPLQTRVAELENLSELREGEMKLLQQDRDHWQQRTQNILSKYDRVDPAELELLNGKLAALETERDEAAAAKDALQTQVDTIPEQLEASRQELRSRLGEQFKARSKELSSRVKDKQTEVDNAIAEKTALQTELEAVKAELQQAHGQTATAETPVVNGVQEGPKATNPTSTSGSSVQVTELEAKVAQLEASVAEKEQELSSLMSEHESKFNSREAELKQILNKRLNEFKTQANAAKAEALKELEDKLQAQHQQELETLRAQSVPVDAGLQKPDENVPPPTPSTNPSTEAQGDQVPELNENQVKQLMQNNETVRKILANNIRKRVEIREAELRKEFEEKQAAGSSAPPTETDPDLEQKLSAEKEALIKEKEEEFNSERQALIKEYEDKIATEKQSLIIQHQEQLTSEKLTFSKESEKKIADQIALAEKRVSVKVNMSENRARMAQAKIDIVKQAAEETPQKAVVEVWDIAKNAKPAPTQVKPSPAPSSTAASASQSASTGAAGTASSLNTAASDTQPQPEAAVTNGPEAAQNPIPNGASKPAQNNAGTGPAALRQISGLPQPRGGSLRGRGGMHPTGQAPPGASAPSGQQQGAAIRGSGIPQSRGRGGRGGARGGAQNVQTNVAPSSSAPSATAGSPKSNANLNPQAVQFTPQNTNKRAREDGEGGDAGNVGKRIRGVSGSVSGGN